MSRVLNPTSYTCKDCGSTFNEYEIKKVVEDYEAYGRTITCIFDVCPCCGCTDIEEIDDTEPEEDECEIE